MAGSILQLLITLRGIDPPVWRRIQVPSSYTFWDLHVAIQDAMGWLDTHAHLFRIPGINGVIGVADEDDPEEEVVAPDWKMMIADHLKATGAVVEYIYDRGSNWIHDVVSETPSIKVKTGRYPRCVDGERACPPEDCGGIAGYRDIIKKLGQPQSNEYKKTAEWLGEEYDPEVFDCAKVEFDDPKKRWEMALGDQEGMEEEVF
jgi:hypothetical protein